MRYLANHCAFRAPKTPVNVVLDLSSISPMTLIAAHNLAEDPRLSKKGFSDSITDVLPPSDRCDLVQVSRYARYVHNVVDDIRSRMKSDPVKTDPVKTDPVKTDPVPTE